MVIEPTRITEDTENVLDLFFSNNSSLVYRVEVIPGISDHETVYNESSLRPAKAQTPPRKVYIYNKADWECSGSVVECRIGVTALWSSRKTHLS